MIQPFVASFMGTAVEFLETVVIAYAIVRAGYPREAISALVLGHALVFILAVFLFPFHELFPIFWLRLVAAVLLTSMGLHWSLKSLKRVWANQRPRWAEDPLGKVQIAPAASTAQAFSVFVFLAMGKSSVIEAGEILVVIFPIAAASSAWAQVLWGVVVAMAVVLGIAFAIHGQLKKIPEVKLKLVIGIVLTVLGTSWLLELYRDYAPEQGRTSGAQTAVPHEFSGRPIPLHVTQSPSWPQTALRDELRLHTDTHLRSPQVHSQALPSLCTQGAGRVHGCARRGPLSSRSVRDEG